MAVTVETRELPADSTGRRWQTVAISDEPNGLEGPIGVIEAYEHHSEDLVDAIHNEMTEKYKEHTS